jgi:hypothetical protein
MQPLVDGGPKYIMNVQTLFGWLSAHKDVLAAAASLASSLGFISIAVALWSAIGQQRETRRTRVFERTKLSLDLMSRFYDDPEFDELRQSLWSAEPSERGSANPLTRAEIRLLNYFEGIALAVHKGALDLCSVRRMLGCPLRQLADNPYLGPFIRDPKNSYEGIRELWSRLGISEPSS